jgi:cyclopropane fatty-acyl-phospholipid synthase-like methyltransferase
MAAFTLRSIDALIGSAELADVERLLDVGGGDGTTAMRIAARHSGMHVTVFDLPSVTRMGARSTAGLDDGEVRFHAGDLFADPFPTGFDGVLFSHVLEVFAEPQIVALLRKAVAVLPAGGRILVYGFNASDDERRGLYSARLSLYLNVLATGTGMAYPAADYERWLRAAGCTRVETVAGLPYEHGLTISVKGT